MKYKRGENPRSLANLRPVKPGQVLNPEGRNQVTKEREAWEIAVGLARAVEAAPTEERRAELLDTLARHTVDAGIAGDRRVLVHLIERLWPLPD